MWLVPWVTGDFDCFAKEDNWVKLEDHAEEGRVYPWQQPVVDPENRSPEARRALGYNVVCDLKEE